MAIRLPHDLPAVAALRAEGVALAPPAGTPGAAGRPLEVALMNLMPEKAVTETQIARVLAVAPFEVALTLIVPDGYAPKTAPAAHMRAFYRPWSEIRARRFDGLIITGAPIETLPFDEVSYWPELCRVLDWSREAVGASYLICWAAQAALYHFHGVPKHVLAEKRFGVFPHRVVRPEAALLRGFDAAFPLPVSRHAEVRPEDLPWGRGLEVLAHSDEAGLGIIEDRGLNAVYSFNHLEYDAGTLATEYRRDLAAGRAIAPPRHYFPDDDPGRVPANGWQPYARLFFRNWLEHLQRRADSKARGTDFRLHAVAAPETVPRVLGRLALLGLAPRALQTRRQGDGGMLVALRLAPAGAATAARIAQALLCLAEVRRVSYRRGDGTGRSVVERKPSGIGTAGPPCPPGRYPTLADSRTAAVC